MKKILVVDDEPYIRNLVVETLNYLGKYELIEAGTGKEALDLVIKEKPDLVILDIMLPDIDGYTICEQIKENPNLNTSVLILSARCSELDQRIGFGMGADDYLTKPFTIKDLIEKVQNLLEKSP
ncbi:MAG: response regulator [Dictyoglomus sp.]|nr:response regulator [Dictyoglomus sp.]MCX7845686.1 response regulator [Dictyoglomaceae bacterium]MDW8188478.1 response regulator [Dictyoglomus sp.]